MIGLDKINSTFPSSKSGTIALRGVSAQSSRSSRARLWQRFLCSASKFSSSHDSCQSSRNSFQRSRSNLSLSGSAALEKVDVVLLDGEAP